jgi:hypothetical protein
MSLCKQNKNGQWYELWPRDFRIRWKSHFEKRKAWQFDGTIIEVNRMCLVSSKLRGKLRHVYYSDFTKIVLNDSVWKRFLILWRAVSL